MAGPRVHYAFGSVPKNCWQNHVNLHRCWKLKWDGYEPCNFFAKNFQTVGPNAWNEKWDEQREKNAFFANI